IASRLEVIAVRLEVVEAGLEAAIDEGAAAPEESGEPHLHPRPSYSERPRTAGCVLTHIACVVPALFVLWSFIFLQRHRRHSLGGRSMLGGADGARIAPRNLGQEETALQARPTLAPHLRLPPRSAVAAPSCAPHLRDASTRSRSSGRNEQRLHRISKALSKILRHKAVALGIRIRDDGFCPVEELLCLAELRALRCSLTDIEEIVRTDQKQRFQLQGSSLLRAVNGHTMEVIDDERLLTRLWPDDPRLPEDWTGGGSAARPLLALRAARQSCDLGPAC
ncbi:unnamed protein product, partial [Durusdinium trenchii]